MSGGSPSLIIFTSCLLAMNWNLLTAEGPPFWNHWLLTFELKMEQTVVIDLQNGELFFTAFKFFPMLRIFLGGLGVGVGVGRGFNLSINPFLFKYNSSSARLSAIPRKGNFTLFKSKWTISFVFPHSSLKNGRKDNNITSLYSKKSKLVQSFNVLSLLFLTKYIQSSKQK